MSELVEEVQAAVPPGEARGVRLASRVEVAESLSARMAGLLGRTLGEDEGLYITPCGAIHTFGMSGPIDAVFVDAEGRALALYHALKPWRASRWVPGARGVLELPPGTLARKGLRAGQRVVLPAAGGGPVRAWRVATNLGLALFWLFLAVRMLPLLASGRAGPPAYLLFGMNTLIAALFVARRPEKRVTESARDRLITLVCILMSFSLRPQPAAALLAEATVSTLMSLSLVLVIVAYLSLGRSFGLIPADRGLKMGGFYAWVRHPLYAGEILFFASFVLGSFTLRNLVLLAGIVVSLHLRAVAEERLLARDEAYRAYCRRVPARYIPFWV